MKRAITSTSVLFFVILVFIVTNFSCKKDPDIQTPESIHGLWIGTYTVDGQPGVGQQYFSFVIKPDGTLINDTKSAGQQHLNIGNWTLSGNSFSVTTLCVYGHSSNIGVQETHTATFDSNNGTFTNGIWKNKPPLTGSGTFSISKVQ